MICDNINIYNYNRYKLPINITFDPFSHDFISDTNFPQNYSFSDNHIVSDLEVYEFIMLSW